MSDEIDRYHPVSPYRFYGYFVSAPDANRIKADLDLGFTIRRKAVLTPYGVTPDSLPAVASLPSQTWEEREGSEFEEAKSHHEFVLEWFRTAEKRAPPVDPPFIATTKQHVTGPEGPYSADFHRRNEDGSWAEQVSLSQALLEQFGDEVSH